MGHQPVQIEASSYREPNRARHCPVQAESMPAFLDKRTGRIELARTRVGLPASTHLIDWLPREWAKSITDNGRISCLRPEIIPGYIRDGIFYPQEELDDH